MVIIGLAVLGGCYLVGSLLGELLGLALGVDANVGGVGFAMVLFVVVADQLRRRGRFPAASEMGVLFWSALYIPIVVAMAATQNVVSALSGGPMALLVGVAATLVGLALVPLVARIGGRAEPLPPLEDDPDEAAGERAAEETAAEEKAAESTDTTTTTTAQETSR